MKHLLAVSLFLSLTPSFAMASTASCPPLVHEPKRLICDASMNYFGQPFTKQFVIDVKSGEDYKVWTGATDFAYPNVGNGDGSLNTIKATIYTETHGNSETCPQQQTISMDLDVLSYKISGAGRSTTFVVDDGFGKPSFQLKMNCKVQ